MKEAIWSWRECTASGGTAGALVNGDLSVVKRQGLLQSEVAGERCASRQPSERCEVVRLSCVLRGRREELRRIGEVFS